MSESEAEIKISRARIKLQRNNPFFAYLSLSLNPIECSGNYPSPTMAVDLEGNLYYNPDFVNSLDDEQMTGVLVHEIMHLVLMHMTRGKDWDRMIGNIACDIAVNEILKDNNFVLPDGAIWSNRDREISLFGMLKIEKCNTKTAEELYHEIMDKAKKKAKELLKSGKAKLRMGDKDGKDGIKLDEEDLQDYEIEASTNDGRGKARNLDRHIRSKQGKKPSREQKEEIERKWTEKVHEAYAGSRLAGKVPEGIERLIGKLHESRVNWKHLLLRYIQNHIPTDFDYSRPNKKSISSGFYMPDTTREKVEVAIAIDVSGSIGQEELTDFLSEIVGIARAYRDKITMTLFTHETDIVDEWVVENGNVQKILKLKIRGGGGTSFIQPYRQYVEKHKHNKLLVWLTDGYGDDIPRKELRGDIIWCLCKDSSDHIVKKLGRVIELR